MPRNQIVQKAGPIAERRFFQTRNHLGDDDQSSTGGEIENANRADNSEPLRASSGDAGPIVHQYQIGTKGEGERDGDTFALIEPTENRIITRHRCRDCQPAWRMSGPPTHRFRRCRMEKLGVHCRRHRDTAEHLGQQVYLVNQHEVMQWIGIRDDDVHASEAEPLQGLPLLVQLGQRVLFEKTTRL